MKIFIVADVDVPFDEMPEVFSIECAYKGGRTSRKMEVVRVLDKMVYLRDRFTSSEPGRVL